jgi:hypothetical protein
VIRRIRENTRSDFVRFGLLDPNGSDEEFHRLSGAYTHVNVRHCYGVYDDDDEKRERRKVEWDRFGF